MTNKNVRGMSRKSLEAIVPEDWKDGLVLDELARRATIWYTPPQPLQASDAAHRPYLGGIMDEKTPQMTNLRWLHLKHHNRRMRRYRRKMSCGVSTVRESEPWIKISKT